MDSQDAVIDVLQRLLEDPIHRLDYIKAFQRWVWESEDLSLDPCVEELLRVLALDLDYYRPGESSTDSTYYGDERLETEVQAILQHLRGAK